jgi:hypothetical protein
MGSSNDANQDFPGIYIKFFKSRWRAHIRRLTEAKTEAV